MFNKKISDLSIGKYVLVSIVTIIIGIFLFAWISNKVAARQQAKVDAANGAGSKPAVKTQNTGLNNQPIVAYN